MEGSEPTAEEAREALRRHRVSDGGTLWALVQGISEVMAHHRKSEGEEIGPNGPRVAAIRNELEAHATEEYERLIRERPAQEDLLVDAYYHTRRNEATAATLLHYMAEVVARVRDEDPATLRSSMFALRDQLIDDTGDSSEQELS